MPARTLFPEDDDTKTEGFVVVAALLAPSPFKPSMSTLSLSGKLTESKKNLACLICQVELGLETTTNNLIQNCSIIKGPRQNLARS
jgi:hypothetical protein